MIAPRLIADFYLTEEERSSGAWASVRTRLQNKLATLRESNDNPKLTDVETATLRGHIECLKFILNLGKEPPQQVAAAARPRPRTDLGALYG